MVVQYVDDSTSSVGANDSEELQMYIQQYYSLLEKYYFHNKVVINGSKTKFMIMDYGANITKKLNLT